MNMLAAMIPRHHHKLSQTEIASTRERIVRLERRIETLKREDKDGSKREAIEDVEFTRDLLKDRLYEEGIE